MTTEAELEAWRAWARLQARRTPAARDDDQLRVDVFNALVTLREREQLEALSVPPAGGGVGESESILDWNAEQADQDKEILRCIKESLARVEPYLKKMRQAEREGRMWANRCNCPEFCFFHTPLAGAKS